MDLRRLLTIARPWLPFVIVLTILAGGAAYVASNVQARSYEAKATLIVGQSLSGENPDFNQLLVSQRLSTTYAAIATTRPILEAVIAELDLDTTPEALLKVVDARAQVDSTLLTLTAQDADPELAAAVANAIADQLIASSPAVAGLQSDVQRAIAAEQRATEAQIRSTQARAEALMDLEERTPQQENQLAALESRIVSLRATYATLLSFTSDGASNLLSVIEPAVAPDVPVSPRPLLNALLAAVLGLLLAGGIVAAVMYFRDVIRDPDEVLDATGLSTLGAIARMQGRNRQEFYRVATLLYPRSDIAEAYRMLRSNIEFAAADVPIRTLVIASATPNEGKTVTAANLAVAFAQTGRRVCLVDGDLRKPGVHLMFDLRNTFGLTTLLRDESIAAVTVAQETEQDNLTVVTTGPLPPNPAELLGSQRMRSAIKRLQVEADLIIMDSPPLLAVTDAAILSSIADGTLLVIDAGRGRKRAVRAAQAALDRAAANVLGAALNRVPSRAATTYYGYGGNPTGKEAEALVHGPDTTRGESVI